MKKNNKKEKGAALINVMLVVLVAVAIGLPLLYLVIANFMFRMFDNNLRSISYKNEIGMDNVYAIIQEIVIEEATVARDKAKLIVDEQVKEEQDAYKAWTSDGRKEKLPGDDGVMGTEDDSLSEDDDLVKLKKYMLEYGTITQIEHDDENFEVKFKYLDMADGSLINDSIKEAYNTYFKLFYKGFMDGIKDVDGDGIEDNDEMALADELKNKAFSDTYKMKDIIDESLQEEQYALITDTEKYPYVLYGTNDYTTIGVKVDYRGKSDATDKYVNSEVSATFTIGVPEFDSASSINQTTVQISNPFLDKTLVIGNTITIADGKNLSITGSSTVSGEGISIDTPAVNIGKKSNLYIKGRLSVNGDIDLAEGEASSKSIFTTEGDVLCNEIRVLGEHTVTNINGTLYISDDMEFNKNNTDMTVGTFMGFNADPNDAQKNSAILFNDKDAGFNIDSVNLNIGTAYIAGTAFLGDIGYRTGESISVRGNYRSYQTLMSSTALAGLSSDYTKYNSTNMIFSNYGGVSLATEYMQFNADGSMTKIQMVPDKDKSKYFYASYSLKDTVGAFLTSIPQAISPNLTVGEWKWTTGVHYDSTKNANERWQLPIGTNSDYAVITNAEKDYKKYTQYFGYGEGNEYKLINNKVPTVVGTNGWINSNNLSVAASKYSSFNDGDDIIVLVSNGNLTLNDSINNKKGIIIAKGNINIENTGNDIKFEGAMICGGKLIVNNNFTLINNSVAVTKIIDSAVSADNKELFNLFRDDGSGNLYTYSTIDTQIASINMNELIKISDWQKSKFDI